MEAVAHWPGRFERIYVASVDHATRSETPFEASAVCARAKALGFDSHRLTLLPSEKKDEASLRQRRYDAIWQLAQELGVSAIATAHTQDDQAESFVMDLMGLGGGPEGAGMLAISPPFEKGGQGGFRIIRPLLNFSRAYLIAVLTALNVNDYFVDPTNLKGEGRRVQVRDFLALHQAPKPRLALLAEKRRLDMDALKTLSEDLVSIEPDQVKVRLPANISESIKFQALKIGLSKFLPYNDNRSAGQVLAQIAHMDSEKKTFDISGCKISVCNQQATFSLHGFSSN